FIGLVQDLSVLTVLTNATSKVGKTKFFKQQICIVLKITKSSSCLNSEKDSYIMLNSNTNPQVCATGSLF
uniref:Uncharacterized protein n=1 Tax=Ciona savignyi TaxID=51511 RepID=H2Y8L3_CIOSA